MNSEALLIQEFIHFSGCKIFPQSQTTNHAAVASPNSKGLQIDCPSLINLLRAHKILDEAQVRQRTIEALFNGHKAKHERKISFQAFKHILEALAPAKFPCFENPTSALIEHIIAKRRAHLAVNSHSSSSALKQQQQQSKSDNSPYGANPSVFERLSDERLFPAAYKRHILSEHSLATVSPTSKSSASSVASSTKAVCSLEGKLPPVYARLTDPTFYRKVHPVEKDAILSGQS